MLRVSADHYIQIGRVFERSRSLYEGGLLRGLPLNEETLRVLAENMASLQSHCEQLKLDVTSRLIQQFVAEFWAQVPSWERAQSEWTLVEKAFQSELQARLFLFVPPYRAGFFGDEFSTVRPSDVDEIPATLSSPLV